MDRYAMGYSDALEKGRKWPNVRMSRDYIHAICDLLTQYAVDEPDLDTMLLPDTLLMAREALLTVFYENELLRAEMKELFDYETVVDVGMRDIAVANREFIANRWNPDEFIR